MNKVKEFQPEKLADAIYNYLQDNEGVEKPVLGYYYAIKNLEVVNKDTVRAALTTSLKRRVSQQEYTLYTSEVHLQMEIQPDMSIFISTSTINAIRQQVFERPVLKNRVITEPCKDFTTTSTIVAANMPVKLDSRRQLSLEKLYTAFTLILEPLMRAVSLEVERSLQHCKYEDEA